MSLRNLLEPALGLCLLVATACGKDKGKGGTDTGIAHRAGIPIIPRGKVVAETAKGEKYLLEIHAPVTLAQALKFYRRQLVKERWGDLEVRKIEPDFYGLVARRGIFDLVGRIRKRSDGQVAIGFERTVRRDKSSWRPPVRKDVPVAPQEIVWGSRILQKGSGRVEIQGRSKATLAQLRKTLSASLGKHGWRVKTAADKRSIRAFKPGRKLTYRLETTRKSTFVRLQLAFDEFVGKSAAMAPVMAVARLDAGTPRPAVANLIPLPKELKLWWSDKPILGRAISKDISTFSMERPCRSPQQLLKEVRGILTSRGYKEPRTAPSVMATTPAGGAQRSLTLIKAKRWVVVIVTRDDPGCLVQLTVTRK